MSTAFRPSRKCSLIVSMPPRPLFLQHFLFFLFLLASASIQHVQAADYLVLGGRVSDLPVLGQGYYPPGKDFRDKRRETAITFEETEALQGVDDIQWGEVEVLKTTVTSNEKGTRTIGADVTKVLKGSFSDTSDRSFLQKNTFLYAIAFVIAREETIKKPHLKNGVTSKGEQRFIDTYGTEVVDVVEKGGYIMLLFRTSTTDVTQIDTIKGEVTAWLKGGNATGNIEQTLTQKGITTDIEISAVKRGGKGTIPIGGTYEEFRDAVNTWAPTVGKESKIPIRIRTVPYKDLFDDFPYPEKPFGALGGATVPNTLGND